MKVALISPVALQHSLLPAGMAQYHCENTIEHHKVADEIYVTQQTTLLICNG